MSLLLPKISVSIVSHLQAGMVMELLTDLERFCKRYSLEVMLTLNLPEALSISASDFSFSLILHVNQVPKGFAANHNHAFGRSTGQFFCVMNPDIRLNDDPFPALLVCLEDATVGVAAPWVLKQNGASEDSARRFPTPFTIILKLFGKRQNNDYAIKGESIRPDWAAGMFLLFPRAIFNALGGFDQRYFLYYEDVDICLRLRLLGYAVVVTPQAKVIHHAQRTSHRSPKYLRWHLASMMRFFCSTVYRQLQRRKFM